VGGEGLEPPTPSV